LPEQLCRELHPKEWGQIQGEERAGGVYWWLEHRHMWISQANLNIFTGFFKTGSLRKEENKTGCLVLFWVSPERSGPASLDDTQTSAIRKGRGRRGKAEMGRCHKEGSFEEVEI
jgi:hypothetical protein